MDVDDNTIIVQGPEMHFTKKIKRSATLDHHSCTYYLLAASKYSIKRPIHFGE
jgi:hypothetical protein